VAGCKPKQKKEDNEAKLAQSKRVQEKMETGKKTKKCDSSGDGKDEIQSLLNKVTLLEKKIEELEKKESSLKKTQKKAAKVTGQVQQDVKTVKGLLKKSFKVAPKDHGFPKSRKAMRNQQKKLEEDLAKVAEHCANIEENLGKVKQEQDNLSDQLGGLLIVEKLETTNPSKKEQDSDIEDYSGGWPFSSDEESEWGTQKVQNLSDLAHYPMCREIYPHSRPGFHVPSCPCGKSDYNASF